MVQIKATKASIALASGAREEDVISKLHGFVRSAKDRGLCQFIIGMSVKIAMKLE